MKYDATAVIIDESSALDTSEHVDPKIEEAVDYINQKIEDTSHSLLDIGRYLLRHFFNNNYEMVAEKQASRKDVSLRQIAKHPDVSMTFASLSNAVKLAAREPVLHAPRYDSLSETHRLLLFRLTEVETITQYAEIAVDKKLSVKRLKNLLVSKKLLAQRGRKSSEEIENRDPCEEFIKNFLAPVEKLAQLSVDLETVDSSVLTDDRRKALEKLRNQIDALLAC